MPSRPLTLRLPASLLRTGFNLARLIAREVERWADGYLLLEELALSGPEREFARELLRRKPNLWLYRCNQRAACGDFLIVDMSPPRSDRRRVLVLELKQGEPLRLDAGGLQLAGHLAAIEELRRAGVVDGTLPPRLARGGSEAILAALVGGSSGRELVR